MIMATISTISQSDIFDTWRTTANTMIGRWNDLGESSSIVITGGTINGTTIGGSTPASGTFTNLVCNSTVDFQSASAIQLPVNSITGDAISGGTAEMNKAVIADAPTQPSHATRKDYVDTNTVNIESNLQFLAFTLGA